MKSCYTEEEINRYIDGELNPGEVERMKEHLKGCEGCAAVFKNLRDIGGILRTYREENSANSGEKGPACPEEGVLSGFADGSLRDKDRRDEIVRHLLGCDYCGSIVAETSRALELASAAEEEGLIQVPERIDRAIKEEYLLFQPILLGRINVKLTELEAESAGHPDSPCRMVYPLAPSSGEIKMAAEEQPLFEFKSKSMIEEESGDEFITGRDKSSGFEKPALIRGLRWSFDRGEINVVIEMRREERGDLRCLIHLTDCYGFPLAGVPLRIEKAGKQIWSHHTELKKDAVFPGMTGGKYRLTISHDRDYFLDINLQ
jgi:Putative zinc-finger